MSDCDKKVFCFWKEVDMRTTLALVVLAASLHFTAIAQKRLLLTPSGEAIPVNRGPGNTPMQSVAGNQNKAETVLPPCPSDFIVGRSDYENLNTNFGFNHGDVASMVFVAPITGTIESVYFATYGLNGIPDSSAYLRLFIANNDGHSHAGYWLCAADSDVGRSPFPDSACGCTTWVALDSGATPPTIRELCPTGAPCPVGGFRITWHRNAVNAISPTALGCESTVNYGESFMVALQLPPTHLANDRTELGASSSPEFRFLKYYQHDRFPGQPGWWARADYDMYIWVVMRPTGSPGVITFSEVPGYILSTEPQQVCMNAYRCINGDTTRSDSSIAYADLRYRINGGVWNIVHYVHTDTGRWCAQIPGQPVGSNVGYYSTVVMTDSTRVSVPTRGYTVLALNHDGYVTTFPTYDFVDITSTGTRVDPNSFFVPSGSTGTPTDDGTSGPYSLGDTFQYFNQNVTHAWFGVNGAIGLATTATDTINVSSNGAFTNFTIPGTAPKNFVGCFWNDLILAPGAGGPGNGSIYYQTMGTQFIVEWYHIGNLNSTTDTSTTFELILDRADSSIKFQYADVGSAGLDSQGLAAIQSDTSTHGWLLLNRYGYPDTTRPRNGFAIKMKNTGPLDVRHVEGMPERFALYQNYPNPFNPATDIRYQIADRRWVSLKIYDLLGREVATLVNEMKEPGNYSVTWDARGVSSGVYFYRLMASPVETRAAGILVDTKKLILLK